MFNLFHPKFPVSPISGPFGTLEDFDTLIKLLLLLCYPVGEFSFFSWLILKPEYLLKSSTLFMREKKEILLLTNVVMSSAKITNFNSFLSTLIPFIWLLLCMLIAKSLRVIIKRNRESGSPWRTPLLSWKKDVTKPLLITQLDVLP